MSSSEWERHEFILTLDLYHNHEFTHDVSDPQVREVADLIGRTPGSVVLRLSNYTHLDPSGTQGMENTGEACREIWEEYYGNEDELRWEAERIRGELSTQASSSNEAGSDSSVRTGEYQTRSTARAGAGDFRSILRERFNDKCILCDIQEPGLLQAAHILPWSDYPEYRGQPDNGLLLCYLHHKAFDIEVFTFDTEYRLRTNPEFQFTSEFMTRTVAERIKSQIDFNGGEPPSADYLHEYNGLLYWWPPDKNSE